MQSNLSRIHHLAKETVEEYYRINERLNDMRLEFPFRIFEKTTEADYQTFQTQLLKRKEEYFALTRRMRKLLSYSDYLKIILAHANEEYGISAILTRVASLGREISTLESFIARVNASHYQQLNAIQPMDFYKSSFTDQLKIYDLPLYVFNEKDLSSLRSTLRGLIKERQSLNDKVASLNQFHTLEIKTFEEFVETDTSQIVV